ncbi:hypothetical protein F6440_06300 [Enterococcus faecium]|nr:hypothetical protein F6440_06300 [Enterococcus faecium]
MFMMRLFFVSDIFCICLLFEKARLFHVLSLIYLMPIHFFAFHNYIVLFVKLSETKLSIYVTQKNF